MVVLVVMMIPVRSGRSHDKQMGTNAGAAEVLLPCHVDAQATGTKMSSLATAISKGTNIVSLGQSICHTTWINNISSTDTTGPTANFLFEQI